MNSSKTAICLLIFCGSHGACLAEDYLCDDGAKLVANYRKSGEIQSVVITFAKSQETIELPQVPSADGARFSAGVNEFWIKGSQATLRHGSAAVTCKR